MTERPLCRDVSLAAAGECLVDAATHVRAAVSDVADAIGFALFALAQGPTMRAVERPMPPTSAEDEARFTAMMAKAREWDGADVARRAREAMAQHDALVGYTSLCSCGHYARSHDRGLGVCGALAGDEACTCAAFVPTSESVCVCGDYPVVVADQCAACAYESTIDPREVAT